MLKSHVVDETLYFAKLFVRAETTTIVLGWYTCTLNFSDLRQKPPRFECYRLIEKLVCCFSRPLSRTDPGENCGCPGAERNSLDTGPDRARGTTGILVSSRVKHISLCVFLQTDCWSRCHSLAAVLLHIWWFLLGQGGGRWCRLARGGLRRHRVRDGVRSLWTTTFLPPDRCAAAVWT